MELEGIKQQALDNACPKKKQAARKVLKPDTSMLKSCGIC